MSHGHGTAGASVRHVLDKVDMDFKFAIPLAKQAEPRQPARTMTARENVKVIRSVGANATEARLTWSIRLSKYSRHVPVSPPNRMSSCRIIEHICPRIHFSSSNRIS